MAGNTEKTFARHDSISTECVCAAQNALPAMMFFFIQLFEIYQTQLVATRHPRETNQTLVFADTSQGIYRALMISLLLVMSSKSSSFSHKSLYYLSRERKVNQTMVE